MTVKIKPLKWTRRAPPAHDSEPHSWWAEGVGGWYHYDLNGMILWRVDDPFTFVEPITFEAAKAWANADHYMRVMNLLENQ